MDYDILLFLALPNVGTFVNGAVGENFSREPSRAPTGLWVGTWMIPLCGLCRATVELGPARASFQTLRSLITCHEFTAELQPS